MEAGGHSSKSGPLNMVRQFLFRGSVVNKPRRNSSSGSDNGNGRKRGTKRAHESSGPSGGSTTDEIGPQSSPPPEPGAESKSQQSTPPAQKKKIFKKRKTTPAPSHLRYSSTSSGDEIPPPITNPALLARSGTNHTLRTDSISSLSIESELDVSGVGVMDKQVQVDPMEFEQSHSQPQANMDASDPEMATVVPIMSELNINTVPLLISSTNTNAQHVGTAESESPTRTATSGGEESQEKQLSRSSQAGFLFPVRRVANHLRGKFPTKRVGKASSAQTTALLQYVVKDVLALAGDVAKKDKKKIITPRHVEVAVRFDDEQSDLWRNVIIPTSGCGGISKLDQLENLSPNSNANAKQ